MEDKKEKFLSHFEQHKIIKNLTNKIEILKKLNLLLTKRNNDLEQFLDDAEHKLNLNHKKQEKYQRPKSAK